MTQQPVKLTRKELYEKVWSQPIRTLAKEYGISDADLKKACTPVAKPRRGNVVSAQRSVRGKSQSGQTRRLPMEIMETHRVSNVIT
jgi:hypothetical protein